MTIKAAIVCLSESFGYFNYSTFSLISKDGIFPMNLYSGRYRFHFFLRCRAGWVYRFCFPGSICCLDKIAGRPDKMLCLHLDRTCACVTKYIHFWMTKWVGASISFLKFIGHISAESNRKSSVSAHLFCHPEVSVFCQGQALYFVKLRLAENKLTPPIWRRQFQI